MIKSTSMQKLKGINYGALSLAILIFVQSTAYGAAQLWNKNTVIFPSNVFSNSIELEDFQKDNFKLETAKSAYIPGGPDQPEVKGFTPIGTSDMVDPFTGDFSYNLPLMDIDGYPINMSYSAGVTMDQEASWVGLGWNLNPGVLNRSMR